MPIGILESFDIYNASLSMIDGSMAQVWTVSPGTPDHYEFVTGLGGQGKALRIFNNVANGASPTLWRNFTADGDITIAFALKNVAIGNLGIAWDTIPEYIYFSDESGNHQFGFSHDVNGKIRIHGEGGNVILTSTTDMQLGQIYRINCQVHSVGLNNVNITTKVNGVADAGLTANGIDLHDSGSTLFGRVTLTSFAYFNSTDFHDYSIDDLVVLYDELVDLPPIELFVSPPTADVLAQWTRSTGASNFGVVDEIPINGDTDYNEAVANNLKDILQYPAPTRTPAFILAMSLITVARKDEAAVRAMRNVLRVAGVDYNGNDENMLESYAHYITHWQTNPATGLAWLPAALPLQGGYESRV